MIDTCQANTLYKHFYSPNIIATGSSEIDQSSYSHHADNDVGVAVIDRWTYYNLDFLETQVTTPTSKLTLGNLFDSYDETKIHSKPGVRWDLFPGGEERGRERLVMDFFGNVQGVEVEGGAAGNETEWKEDLKRLEEIVNRARARSNSTSEAKPGKKSVAPAETLLVKGTDGKGIKGRAEGAAKVEAGEAWGQRILGAGALLGCALLWGGASWLEASR